MLRFRSVFVLAVCVLCTSQAAVAQAPFIENYYGGGGGGAWQYITSSEFVDIGGTEKTVTVPAGRAVIFWTMRAYPDTAMIRPMIGSHAPDPAAIYYGGVSGPGYLSGTWTTNIEGGILNVKLQGALTGPGSSLVVDSPGGISWTLIVFPVTSGGVPAVGGVGLGVLIAILLGVGAFIIKRRQLPTT